jgi:hypothetical protein
MLLCMLCYFISFHFYFILCYFMLLYFILCYFILFYLTVYLVFLAIWVFLLALANAFCTGFSLKNHWPKPTKILKLLKILNMPLFYVILLYFMVLGCLAVKHVTHVSPYKNVNMLHESVS